jgi:hypothetical protein
MMLEEDTVVAPSTWTWRVDRQDSVRFVVVLSRDNLANIVDRHSDSLMQVEEAQKPRNWMRVEGKNRVRLAEQRS